MRGEIGAYGALGQIERAVKLAREAPHDILFWVVRQAQARRFAGDPAGALAMVEGAIKRERDTPHRNTSMSAADLACCTGKFAESRAHLERLCPPLLEPSPRFDDFGFCNASGYAFVLQRLGDRDAGGTGPGRVPELHPESATTGDSRASASATSRALHC